MEHKILDIRTQSMIDIDLPENSFGDIFIMGRLSAMTEKIAFLQRFVIDSDRSAKFYQYRLRVLETVTEDYNIVCPIKDPVSRRVFYVMTNSEPGEFVLAVSSIISEAENQMRKFAEEALFIAAMENPDLLREVVDKVIIDAGDESFKRCISHFNLSPEGPEDGVSLEKRRNNDDLKFNSDTCLSSNHVEDDMDDEANIKNSAADFYFEKGINHQFSISAKQKKEAFNKLPGRLNKAFERQNPVDYEIVRQTLGTYSAAEINAIIMELARTKPHLLRDFHYTAINSASRYEIHVRPWKSDYRNDFRDRYLYCIYLKNAKGQESAVTFKNYPSYCIYMMYIIDRVQRGDEVTDLALKDLREEFCKLYKTILSETDQNIKNFYDGMDYRTIPETGKVRKGRYDDYIKDIHETLERLVGGIDSIPLKVGHGRCLGVLPERIFIDDKLAEFRFA